MHAAACGHLRVVAALLAKGANAAQQDASGANALSFARKNEELVTALHAAA